MAACPSPGDTRTPRRVVPVPSPSVAWGATSPPLPRAPLRIAARAFAPGRPFRHGPVDGCDAATFSPRYERNAVSKRRPDLTPAAARPSPHRGEGLSPALRFRLAPPRSQMPRPSGRGMRETQFRKGGPTSPPLPRRSPHRGEGLSPPLRFRLAAPRSPMPRLSSRGMRETQFRKGGPTSPPLPRAPLRIAARGFCPGAAVFGTGPR